MGTMMLAFWIAVWLIVIPIACILVVAALGAMLPTQRGGLKLYEGDELARWKAKARREDIFCWIIGICLVGSFLAFAPWGE
jgi:hypothetical protein